ncbi:MAG TPA: peptide deformylase [Solirubrobacteraceae bacterium]|nr:peptide deformylase [Solirubrobacteraceae bacterium]
MSVLQIAQVGDPVLRRRAAEVLPEELHSPAVQQLIDDLIETRRAAGGAGLAANQVSELKRIAVVEVDEAARRRYPYKPPFELTVIVNPVIEPLSSETLLVNEGCLSVPGLRGDVPRHRRVRVHHLDRDGQVRETIVDGLTAGTFQHELDHLDGVLFLDRVRDPTSFSTWEEFERHHREAFLARVRPWIYQESQV